MNMGSRSDQKKSMVAEISNREQQMHWDGSAPRLRYTVVHQEPSLGSSLGGIQHAAPGSAGRPG